MSFSEETLENIQSENIQVVINGCRDCILRGYNKEIKMQCFVTKKEINLKKLNGYQRPFTCLLPLNFGKITIRPHTWATTV